MPYTFCGDGGTYDDVDFVFEQDCQSGYTQYSDFFIFRIDLHSMATTAAWIDS